MIIKLVTFMLFWTTCEASDYYYRPYNITRSTVAGIAAYRSSLTLDWLQAEDMRQRELVEAFETVEAPARVMDTDCIAYPRPAPGKIGGYLIELLRNLEGDNGVLIQELFHSLIRSKILVETSAFEAEPNFDSLVETPQIMQGEPHATFPRIMAIIWMAVTDTSTVKKHGWCAINKVNQFVAFSKPRDVAKHMRSLDMIIDRARFVMEDFIRTITPVNTFQSKKPLIKMRQRKKMSDKKGEHNKITSCSLEERFTTLVNEHSDDIPEIMAAKGLPEYNRSVTYPPMCSLFKNIIVCALLYLTFN